MGGLSGAGRAGGEALRRVGDEEGVLARLGEARLVALEQPARTQTHQSPASSVGEATLRDEELRQ